MHYTIDEMLPLELRTLAPVLDARLNFDPSMKVQVDDAGFTLFPWQHLGNPRSINDDPLPLPGCLFACPAAISTQFSADETSRPGSLQGWTLPLVESNGGATAHRDS
jgi:hypothetical protein